MARPVLNLIVGVLLLAPGAAFAQTAAQGGSGQVVTTAPPAQPSLSKPAARSPRSATRRRPTASRTTVRFGINRIHGEVSVGGRHQWLSPDQRAWPRPLSAMSARPRWRSIPSSTTTAAARSAGADQSRNSSLGEVFERV